MYLKYCEKMFLRKGSSPILTVSESEELNWFYFFVHDYTWVGTVKLIGHFHLPSPHTKVFNQVTIWDKSFALYYIDKSTK